MTSIVKRAVVVAALGLACARVDAQTFVSPFAAVDFGSDTGCVNVVLCTGRYLNAGIAVGRIGRSYGVEEEVAYARDFFGVAPNLSSNVLTLMSNVIVMRHLGRWNPYAVGGVGVMRTVLRFTEASFYATDRATAAWDVGGGASTFFGPRLGVRIDGRYVRSVKEVKLSGFSLSDPNLGFGRASAGLVVRF